jgi:hypothetical protein
MKGTSGDPVCRQTAYSVGGIFEDFGSFLAILVDFGHFWASFFPFLTFLRVPATVYSQTDLEADV